ncbi:D-alanyl-D-alanine carboxypeptidase family protein [Salibacterium halotolerans]|uniref:serine-type D-Ala-D-Ala carboxypeptidase n=1 Tax=Salibacterium halotolerans TaxID=1884432 RepID=A0A1I5NVU1_9BACI|nr:D-alanyl-D-alanine carboxypeptidase family protein [Salibacterium halotolerans]SFP25872.1 D-alanyl-D-alanine carboxypeptidase [Salibacterium halotolerans]
MDMKWCRAAVLLLLLGIFPLTAAADNTEGVDTSAEAALLMEQQSGRVLFEKQAHEKQNIASITKIMTAVLALESGKWKQSTKISENAYGVEGSSLYLKPGETMTLKDLTTGLMLRSGNDAAVAVAEFVGGSTEGFVYMMNEKAHDIGMENTQFANPHGLDEGGDHYSTAYDMALLMRYAMQKERFREVTGLKTYEAPQPGNGKRVWKNKNKLLTSMYEYTTGGKTGYTRSAGRTLVSSARKNDMGLIAVTLDAPSDWKDHISMFEWGFSSFELFQLGKADETLNSGYRENGRLFLPRDFYYPLKEDERNDVSRSVSLSEQDNHYPKGISAAGKITWTLEDQPIHSMPVFIDQPEEKNQGWFRTFYECVQMFMGGR